MIFWKFTNNNILTHHFFHVTMKVTQTSSEDSMRKITVYNPAAGDGTAGEGDRGLLHESTRRLPTVRSGSV